MNLIDVPCLCNDFSWVSGDGRSMSRLDRFLLYEPLIVLWGVVDQVIGKRDISCHCPVWLKLDKVDWGPKLFKVNASWFKNKDFLFLLRRNERAST